MEIKRLKQVTTKIFNAVLNLDRNFLKSRFRTTQNHMAYFQKTARLKPAIEKIWEDISPAGGVQAY